MDKVVWGEHACAMRRILVPWPVLLVAGALLVTLSACGVDSGPAGIGTPPSDTASGGDGGGTTSDAPVEGPGGEGSALDGRTFLSTGVRGQELVADSVVQMTFDGDSLSVQAGCNTMFGTYAVERGILRVTGLAQTEMGCAPELMDQDQWLNSFLQAGPELTEREDGFTLSSDGVELDLTDRVVADPDVALEGPKWVLTTSFTETAHTSIRGMENASLVFTDGSVRLQTGCNSGGGSYTLEGDTLTLGAMRTTLRACEELAMEVEQAMLAVLRQEELTVHIEASTLQLTAPDGTALGFTAEPASDVDD